MPPARDNLSPAALAVGHGASFAQNYVLGREYATLTLRQVMMRPYDRIVLLHLAIIGGGFLVIKLGSPLPPLLVLVAAKIGLDVWLHRQSRRRARAQALAQGG